MISSLFIANRGEIARRIMRTAQAMGIRCIVPYTTVDAQSCLVREADEAYLLPHQDVRQAYLDVTTLLNIAKQSGAQAVHPGYGFLSEHAGFAQACLDAGLIWIGPPPAVIKLMGDKGQAKHIAARSGLPLLPCDDGSSQDNAKLYTQAQQIGFPVLIKACAGGGGKGMRQVQAADEFHAALAACRREALASFGDDRVILERYIQHARHIEVQLLADQQGHVWSLFERDCSVQRRYQKVIEEAPAPNFPEQLRQDLQAYARQLAQEVGYVGAGTIEFLYDPSAQKLYFMEMNTRLQVEHPVTEMITAIDLVAWQIRVACGEALPEAPQQPQGHAIEVRVYAEQARQNFLPMAGYCETIHWPQGPYIRVDTALEESGEISPHFDPMIAKIIVWGEDREAARLRMLHALKHTMILGIHHNLEFLQHMLEHSDFIQAQHDTRWIERSVVPAWPKAVLSFEYMALAAVLIQQNAHRPALAPYWRMHGQARSYVYLVDEEHAVHRVMLIQTSEHVWQCSDGAQQVSIAYQPQRQSFCINQHPEVRAHWSERMLWVDGQYIPLRVHHAREHAQSQGAARMQDGCVAPMPSKVIRWMVEVEQEVGAHTPLMILEAMKMEHTILAPAAGHVREFYAQVGEQVQEGSMLLAFTPLEEQADSRSVLEEVL